MDLSKENQNNTKLALYPGRFDHFTEANDDIVQKALLVFDEVLILACDKNEERAKQKAVVLAEYYENHPNVGVGYWSNLLVNFIQNTRVSAIIRTLKNNTDLRQEQDLYYSHQDLGIQIPFVYFMTSREKAHMSSKIHQNVLDYLN